MPRRARGRSARWGSRWRSLGGAGVCVLTTMRRASRHTTSVEIPDVIPGARRASRDGRGYTALQQLRLLLGTTPPPQDGSVGLPRSVTSVSGTPTAALTSRSVMPARVRPVRFMNSQDLYVDEQISMVATRQSNMTMPMMPHPTQRTVSRIVRGPKGGTSPKGPHP